MSTKSSRQTSHPIYIPCFDFSSIKALPPLLDHFSTPQLTVCARGLLKESASLLSGHDKASAAQSLKALKTLLAKKGSVDRAEILPLIKEILGKNLGVSSLMTAPATAQSQFGFLLFEGLEYEPVGTEPSLEVVRSMFLAPGEEIEVTKKTWSKVELEFTEATEQMRSEEREAALSSDKELAESLNKQTQFSANMSTSVQATGTSGLYTVQAKADTTLSGARTTASAEATKEHQAMTSKAVARMQQQHKMTYGQKTQFTSEYATVEKIKNPNTTHAVTITLRKLLQKWEIRHMSYGARFCLDVMVKNPGKNLRADAIPRAFDPTAVPDPNPDSPPANGPAVPVRTTSESKQLTFGGGNETKLVMFTPPQGYEVEYCTAIGDDGSAVTFDTGAAPNLPGFISGGQMMQYIPGKCWAAYVHNYAQPRGRSSQTVTVTACINRTQAMLQAWKNAARPFVVEEARRAWEANNAARQAQQAALEAESNVPPAQILRKEERDELFSAVVRFLVNGESEPEPITPDEHVTPTTSVVRKLSEALEWETASCFLYPYWWNTSLFEGIEGGALVLSHKNFLRREFVRSSWARVMVPVGVGYEAQVLVALYGDGMQKAIEKADACGDDMQQALAVAEAIAAPIGPLVKSYLQVKEFNQKVNPATPQLIKKWFEYTPTDEITASMDLLRDSGGQLVDIAEPYLRKSQDAEIGASEAITELQSQVSDKIQSDGLNAELKASAKVKDNNYKVEYSPDDGDQQ